MADRFGWPAEVLFVQRTDEGGRGTKAASRVGGKKDIRTLLDAQLSLQVTGGKIYTL